LGDASIMSHILPSRISVLAEVCLSTVQSEIAALEERLRVAELGPDTKFFEEVLADDAVLCSSRRMAKPHLRSGKWSKRTSLASDHGTAAVVTCEGALEGRQIIAGLVLKLKFQRTQLSCEVDRYVHHNRHGHAVQESRQVLPLPHGV
jgi:hypothetical protein